MADAKPKKSKKNQERNPEIVLCKMFTGNYWENENNLGHETINMFVPNNSQEGESYIYLPASGDYKLDEHQIKHVLLVKSIAESDGKYVQVIGMAEVDKELLWDYEKDKSKIEQCLIGGTEFVGLCNLWKIEAENNGASLEEKINKLARIYKIASFDVNNETQLAELAVKMGFIRREKKQLSSKELFDAYNRLKHPRPDWLKLTDSNRLTNDAQDKIKKACGVTLGRHSNELNYKFAVKQELIPQKPFGLSFEKFKNKLNEKLEKARSLNQIHKEQKYILDLKYEGVQYKKLYQKNRYFDETDEGLNIYASLRVKNLKITDKSIILALPDVKIEEKEGVIRLKNRKNDLSSTKQIVYLDNAIETENGEKLLTVLQNLQCWRDNKKTNDNFNDGIEDSFLTVIKKEYDELVYSNLFAYFFAKDRSFFKYFFEHLRDKNDGAYEQIEESSLKISTDYILEADEKDEQTVKRELKNIDILIDTEDSVIVIENKIKSAINGLQHDINGEIVKDQLVKYYQYVEDNFATKSKKAYLIFAPDYNNIKEEEFKIKGVWKIVRYSKIYKVCKDYMNEQSFQDLGQTDPIRQSYFMEFVKALYIHTDSSANNYYRQMQKRLLRIKNEQGKNK